MRTITETKTVFTFAELSEEAQSTALEKQAEFEGELWEYDMVYHDAGNIAEILGIDLRTRVIKLMNGSTRMGENIWFSGFWSQGDGACFEGYYAYAKDSRKKIREYAPQDEELHRIADELYELQKPCFFGLKAKMTHRGHYYHENCMEVDVSHAQDDAYNYRNWQDRALPEEELTDLMRRFAKWIYRQLEADYDYRVSEEACRESIEANEYEFLEDGTRA